MEKNNIAKEWKLLTGFVIFAFLFRLFMLRYEYVITGDGIFYVTLGKNLVSGNWRDGLSMYWPPLYPFLTGVASLLFQDLEFSGRFVSLLAGSLLVIPVYLWSRDSYGKEAAYVSVFFTILYPSLTFYSRQVMTESTYTLLLMTGILTGWSAISRGYRSRFFLTGLVFGLCYLTRPEAIGYMGLMIVIILGIKLFSLHPRLKGLLISILILLLGFTVLSFPYILYLHHETGRWTISEKFSPHFFKPQIDWNSQWFGLSADGETTLADRLWAGSPVEEVSYPDQMQSGPARPTDLSNFLFLQLKALKIEYEDILPKIFPPLFILLSGLGLFRTLWSRERAGREIYLLLFLIAALIGYAIMVMPNRRYLEPMLPILICWASKGVIELEKWLSDTIGYKNKSLLLRNHKFLKMLILSFLILSLIPRIIEPMRGDKWDQPYELKETALWIMNNTVSSPLIMSTSPIIAFYAGGKHIYLPHEEYSVVIEYARRKKVDFIVINERRVPWMPRLKSWLDEKSQHPGLDLIYEYNKKHGYKVLVFKLADPSRSSAARWE